MMKAVCVILVVIVSANAAPYSAYEDNSLKEDATVIDLSQYGTSIYGTPTGESGRRVAQYNPERDQLNPEELGEYLEGDMLMPPDLARNGLVSTSSHWPGGVVPYEITGSFGENSSFFS